MSRNSSRKKAGATDDKVVPPADPVIGTGGLNFSTPTEHVELPSGGRFYEKGHPLHGRETVEIKYMTAKEEDILTSQNLLKNCLLYTSPSPRDRQKSRMPSSA